MIHMRAGYHYAIRRIKQNADAIINKRFAEAVINKKSRDLALSHLVMFSMQFVS